MGAFSPIQTLADEVGLKEAVLVAVGLARRRLFDRPFAGLPAAADRRERQSRAQAEPAILLYRALRDRLDRPRALAVATKVITSGAIHFLERRVGDLQPDRYRQASPETRRAQASRWLSRFFTATARLDRADPEEVVFTVTACALARLARAAGHPELAGAFCVGDGHFLASRQPPIALDRPQTIAEGADTCVFRLRLAPVQRAEQETD